jgi:hypothetical protein
MVGHIDSAAPGEAQVPGPDQIIAQDPHGRPQHTRHAPRPKAHASTLEQWLAGFFDTEFPPHFFRPPTWGVIARIV